MSTKLTDTIKNDLYKFFIVAFDAAPGATYMSQLADAVEADMTIEQIVEVFTTKPEFTSVYPNFFTNAQFANKLINTVVGTAASADAIAKAKTDVEAALNSGFTRAQVIHKIFGNLSSADLASEYAGVAKQLENQIAVAKYVTEELLDTTTNLTSLRAVIANVTDTTDVSTTAALAAVVAGSAPAPVDQTFTLTTSAADANEGSTVYFTLDTTNVASGTQYVYTLSGVAAADVLGGSLSGTVTVGASGKVVIPITLREDAATEGAETITMTVAGKSASVAVNDTSLTPPPASQTIVLNTDPEVKAGGAGDDFFRGTDKTLLLDKLDGGLGTDTLVYNDTTGGVSLTSLALEMTSIETVEARSKAAIAADTSGFTGITSLNATFGTTATLAAAAATNIAVTSGVTDAVGVNGGKNVTVDSVTANQAITVGNTKAAAGDVTVTSSKQGTGAVALTADGSISVTSAAQTTGTITVNGGTAVNVTATASATSGAIAVGGTTAPSGAVVVTQNLNSDGSAAVNGGAITTTGGTSVTINVNATSTAKDNDADADITVGAITVNAGSKTASVTINQNDTATVFTKAAVTAVGATQTLKFGALSSGQTTTVDGLTFTASKNLTAAEVAAAFANLTATDKQSSGGPVSNGEYSGSLIAGWTSGAATGDTVVFTATTHNATALVVTAGNVDPTSTYVAGTAAVAEDKSTNVVTFGAVRVDGNATAAVKTITLDGYASADLGKTGTDLNALTALSLKDSAGAADVATSATALDLTVNNVNHAVRLDETAATIASLNLIATGKDSAFALTAAVAKTLAVSGDKAVDLTGSTLTVLDTVTVKGSAGLTLDANVADTIKSIDASGTTGTVTATIEGQRATYTGGAGKDVVTLATDASITKAIALGAGDDTLSFGTLTVTGTTANLAGGDGNDTLSMNFASAAGLDDNATFKSFVSGFERLTISNSYTGGTANSGETLTLDLANLGFTNYVTTSGSLVDADAGESDTLVLDKMANNGTVVLTAAGVIQVNVAGATDNANDVLNVLTTSNNVTDYGTLTANKVEKINFTIDDVDNDTAGDTETLALAADSVTAITIANASDLVGATNQVDKTNLTLSVTGATALATVDASAMRGKLTYVADDGSTTVTGGSGADDLTASGASDTLIGGAGNDTLRVADGAAASTLQGGAGKDTYVIGVASNSSSYSTISGTAAELSGDVIQFGTAIADFNTAKIVLGATAVFQDYANEAAKGNTADNHVSWFQFAGDTYVVQNKSTSITFVNGTDAIVKIVGLVDFSYNHPGALEIA